jgi:cytochrome c556
MSYTKLGAFLCAAVLAASCGKAAVEEPQDEGPQHERHELMEDVGKAAKVIGNMLKGETDYDAAAALQSLQVFQDVAGKFGALFPEGSETGGGTEAAPAIWEDRSGFDAALEDWAAATAAAIESAPQTREAAGPVFNPVFKACKNCHDNYRLDD